MEVQPVRVGELFEFGFGPIEVWAEDFGAMFGEAGEFFFDFFDGGAALGDGLVDVDVFGEVVEDELEFFEAEALDEVFDDEGGFVVSELEVEIAGRGEEGGAEFTDRGEVFAEDHFPVMGVHGLAPGGVGLEFFVDGDAFAEPTGHFVVSDLKSDDVTELVPEDGFPVGGVSALGGGAVGGDDGAEADTEEAGVIGDAEGSDAEIFLFGEDFDGGGFGEGEAVFGAEGILGFLEELEGLLSVDFGFVSGHAEDEILVGESLEFLEAFLQSDEVEGGDVVGVFLIDFIGQAPAFFFVAEAQEVLGQLDGGGEAGRVLREGVTLEGRPFGEAIFLGEFTSDEMVDVGV